MCDKQTICDRCDTDLSDGPDGPQCYGCGWTPPAPCEACGGPMATDNGCGVAVCDKCDNHKGLARCFCGWSASGGNGLRELQDMGENCDEGW